MNVSEFNHPLSIANSAIGSGSSSFLGNFQQILLNISKVHFSSSAMSSFQGTIATVVHGLSVGQVSITSFGGSSYFQSHFTPNMTVDYAITFAPQQFGFSNVSYAYSFIYDELRRSVVSGNFTKAMRLQAKSMNCPSLSYAISLQVQSMGYSSQRIPSRKQSSEPLLLPELIGASIAVALVLCSGLAVCLYYERISMLLDGDMTEFNKSITAHKQDEKLSGLVGAKEKQNSNRPKLIKEHKIDDEDLEMGNDDKRSIVPRLPPQQIRGHKIYDPSEFDDDDDDNVDGDNDDGDKYELDEYSGSNKLRPPPPPYGSPAKVLVRRTPSPAIKEQQGFNSPPTVPPPSVTLNIRNGTSPSIGVQHSNQWDEFFDERKGRPYWRSRATNETTWQQPIGGHYAGPVSSGGASPETVVWEEIFNKKKGKPYWKNIMTGEKTWKRPAKATAAKEGYNIGSRSREEHSFTVNGGEGGNSVTASRDEGGHGRADTAAWEEIFNRRKGKPYWRNRTTGEKTWKNPLQNGPSTHVHGDTAGADSGVPNRGVDGESAAVLSGREAQEGKDMQAGKIYSREGSSGSRGIPGAAVEWVEIFNKKKGKTYWANQLTGEKTWRRPASVATSQPDSAAQNVAASTVKTPLPSSPVVQKQETIVPTTIFAAGQINSSGADLISPITLPSALNSPLTSSPNGTGNRAQPTPDGTATPNVNSGSHTSPQHRQLSPSAYRTPVPAQRQQSSAYPDPAYPDPGTDAAMVGGAREGEKQVNSSVASKLKLLALAKKLRVADGPADGVGGMSVEAKLKNAEHFRRLKEEEAEERRRKREAEDRLDPNLRSRLREEKSLALQHDRDKVAHYSRLGAAFSVQKLGKGSASAGGRGGARMGRGTPLGFPDS